MTGVFSKLTYFWRQPGPRLVIILGLFFGLAPFLPLVVHESLYSLSLTIKTFLTWIIPLVVLFYVAHTVQSFKEKAPLFLVALLIFEGFSNFTSLWYSFGLGHLAYDFLPGIPCLKAHQNLAPLWTLPLTKPSWFGADKTSALGVALGFLSLMSPFKSLQLWISKGKLASEFLLVRAFSKIIPLFILGFVANLYMSGLLNHLKTNLAALLPWLCGGIILYAIFLFWLGSFKSPLPWSRHIQNVLPAGFLALTSGCSLSTMPWTIEGTRKNMQAPDLADAIIPATTNIQQIGDCIANAFFCYIIYGQFMGKPPNLELWIPFTLVFTAARFTTAAVMGGAVFIMLPIYENYLHFTPTMIALILAFNVVMDPIITGSNVMMNGALCRLFEKVWGWVLKTFNGFQGLNQNKSIKG